MNCSDFVHLQKKDIVNSNNFCVIMAGGLGTRFWPMSRTQKPKQFIDVLGSGKTLIQQTFDRMSRVCPIENIIVVTNASYESIVKDQLPKLDPAQILLEPARRNTAPCVAYASFKIKSINPTARIIVAPSDHIILDETAFVETAKMALEAVENSNCLMTMGITPSRPDTGYGYIQYRESDLDNNKERIKKVKTFTEKPQLDIAKTFIKSGDFLWNAGIFIWSVQSIIKALERHMPELYQSFADGLQYFGTEDEKSFIYKTYMVSKNISIDYGIMEKADNVYVAIADFGWSDLGTWGSLYENRSKDVNGNAVVGKNVMLYDTRNCIVHMQKDKLVLLQGLENYIVVESDGILLVCRKEDEQNIRQFVNDVLIEKGEQFV